jgi:MscS family membrane protein
VRGSSARQLTNGALYRQSGVVMQKIFSWIPVLLALILLQRVDAQAPKTDSPQTKTTEQAKPVEDPLGRSTPHGTVVGLVTAAQHGNLDRASEYLESSLPSSERQELAEQLWVVLDRKLFTTLDRVSDKPDGDLEDGLTNRDRIGLVESPSGNVEMFLDRVQRGQGNAIWLFSSISLQEIPRLYEEVRPPWFERYVPERLRTIRWLSLPLYRWIAILLFVPLIFVIAALSTRVLAFVLSLVFRRLTREQSDRKQVSVGPLRLLVLALFFYGASFLGITLATRNFWHRVAQTVAVIGLCWLSIRLVDLVAESSLKRLQRVHRSADTALVRLISRLLKVAAVIVTCLLLLYLSDVELTAALTGLGVGGLAIGFGAQKTIENLFGGIMMISDKPVSVGDVCRVGGFFGTVEDIGIRSTRIRTLDRTVVSVPNGQLAAMSLENFAVRDRILFHHTVALGRQATPNQLRSVLAQIRRMLASHAAVDSTSARTRFIRVTGYSLDLEIFAYVLETDYPLFLAIQEELLLGVMDIIETSGTTAV